MTSRAPDDVIIEARERIRAKQKLESSVREARQSLASEKTRSAELVADLRRRLDSRQKDRNDSVGSKRGLIEEA